MNKKLNEKDMRSELSSSAFFASQFKEASSPSDEAPVSQSRDLDTIQPVVKPIAKPEKYEPVTPRHHGPSTPAPPDELIEAIRRAVKPPGKEDATYRFSGEEKKALADLVYTYGNAGIRTSQNEITRIGINNLLEDYKQNGTRSVLARALERLNE